MASFLDRHLWLFFILPVVLGLALPSLGLIFSPYSIPLLFCIMTLSLMDVPLKQSVLSAANKKGAALIFIQYVVFSALASGVGHFLPRELFIGFVVVAATPAGISVPAIVDLHGGDKTKAVSLTLLDTLLAPIMMPAMVLLFAGKSLAIDAAALFLNVALLVVVPMGLALFLRKAQIADKLNHVRHPLNLLLLTALVWGITAQSAPFFYQHPGEAVVVGIALIGISSVVFALGWLLGKTREEKITYATFCYYKNNTFSVTLITSFFGAVAAAVGVIHIIVIRIVLAASSFLFREKQGTSKSC
ncbi:hypothetical protein HY994_03485 [Candidatus Micrarchaeota archaeon]|nr:hypothetical protein [Candidatus Micrarchaeota archaeon]